MSEPTITVAGLSIRLRRLERNIERAIEAELRAFRDETGVGISDLAVSPVEMMTIDSDGPEILVATVRAKVGL